MNKQLYSVSQITFIHPFLPGLIVTTSTKTDNLMFSDQNNGLVEVVAIRLTATLRCQINKSNRLAFLDFFLHPIRLFGTTCSHFPP